MCLKVKQVWFSLHPNSGCASFHKHSTYSVWSEFATLITRRRRTAKSNSLFFTLFWKVTNLKPLQWCRISLISISIPHQLKPKELLLTWLKQLWSVWPWRSLISKAIRWCWNYICDVCIQWGRSGGGKMMEAKLWLCSFFAEILSRQLLLDKVTFSAGTRCVVDNHMALGQNW